MIKIKSTCFLAIYDFFDDIGEVFGDIGDAVGNAACGTYQAALDQIDCESISNTTAAAVVDTYNTICDLTLCGVTTTSGKYKTV